MAEDFILDREDPLEEHVAQAMAICKGLSPIPAYMTVVLPAEGVPGEPVITQLYEMVRYHRIQTHDLEDVRSDLAAVFNGAVDES